VVYRDDRSPSKGHGYGWRQPRRATNRPSPQCSASPSNFCAAHPGPRPSARSAAAANTSPPSHSRTRGKPSHATQGAVRARAKIGAPGFEPGTSATQRPRATRLRHAPRASNVLYRHSERSRPISRFAPSAKQCVVRVDRKAHRPRNATSDLPGTAVRARTASRAFPRAPFRRRVRPRAAYAGHARHGKMSTSCARGTLSCARGTLRHRGRTLPTR
jgi:hypothetical protein